MNRIKEARTSIGLSQYKLAVMIGAQPSSISRWENHKSHPSQLMVDRMVELFNCTPSYLLGDDDNLK